MINKEAPTSTVKTVSRGSSQILIRPEDDEKDSFDIIDSVEIIDKKAFASSRVEYLKFPNSITEIGKETFKYSSLRSISIEQKIILGEEAFCNALSLRTAYLNCEKVPKNCFLNCENLRVRFEDGLVSIDNMAFIKATLQEINFPRTLKNIGDFAFSDTVFKNTRKLKLPKGLETIGRNAFDTYIGAIYLPDTMKDITNLLEYTKENGTDIYISDYLFNKLNLSEQSNLRVTSLDEVLKNLTFKELNDFNKSDKNWYENELLI